MCPVRKKSINKLEHLVMKLKGLKIQLRKLFNKAIKILQQFNKMYLIIVQPAMQILKESTN